MMSLTVRAFLESVIFDVSKPGTEQLWKSRVFPGVGMLRKRTKRGNPLWAATQQPRLAVITNNLLEALSQHATQSGMITKLGRLKSGKRTNRSANDENPNQVSFMRRPSLMEQGNPLRMRKNLMIERCNPW